MVKHTGQLVFQRVVLARRRRAVDGDVTDVLTQLRHCLALCHTDIIFLDSTPIIARKDFDVKYTQITGPYIDANVDECAQL